MKTKKELIEIKEMIVDFLENPKWGNVIRIEPKQRVKLKTKLTIINDILGEAKEDE